MRWVVKSLYSLPLCCSLLFCLSLLDQILLASYYSNFFAIVLSHAMIFNTCSPVYWRCHVFFHGPSPALVRFLSLFTRDHGRYTTSPNASIGSLTQASARPCSLHSRPYAVTRPQVKIRKDFSAFPDHGEGFNWPVAMLLTGRDARWKTVYLCGGRCCGVRCLPRKRCF